MKKTVCHVVNWWSSRREIIFTHRIKIHTKQKRMFKVRIFPRTYVKQFIGAPWSCAKLIYREVLHLIKFILFKINYFLK